MKNSRQFAYRTGCILLSVIWLINGFYCKLLNQIPRHQLIVSRILGNEYANELTKLIGIAEIIIAIWILSGFKSRANAVLQMIIIATMNTIEFFLAKDLLLFGAWNAVWAVILILIIYFNEFHLNRKHMTVMS